jgi:hypothetical protein
MGEIAVTNGAGFCVAGTREDRVYDDCCSRLVNEPLQVVVRFLATLDGDSTHPRLDI